MKERNESKETEAKVKKSESRAKKFKLEEYAREIDEISAKIRAMGKELADLERAENQYKGQDLMLISVNADEFNPESLSNAQHLVALRDAEGAYIYKLWASHKGKWQLIDLNLGQDFILPPEWQGKNRVFVNVNNPIFNLLNQKDTLSMGTSLKIVGEDEKIFREESAKIRALSGLMSNLNLKRAALQTALTEAGNTKETIKRGKDISNLVTDPKKISDKIKGLAEFNEIYEKRKIDMQHEINELYFLAKEFAVKKDEININKLIAAGNTIFIEEAEELSKPIASATREAPSITNYTIFNDPQNKKMPKSEPEMEKQQTPKSLASSKRKSVVLERKELKGQSNLKRRSDNKNPNFITKETKMTAGTERQGQLPRSVSSKRLKSSSVKKPNKLIIKEAELERSQPQVEVSSDRPRRLLKRQSNVTNQQLLLKRRESKPEIKKPTYFAEEREQESREEPNREDSPGFKK